jgi:hypothetical protein
MMGWWGGGRGGDRGADVERLYCKRPILFLSSSTILTSHPPHRPPSVPPPRLWCGGRTHSLGGERGGGSIFWKTRDTALYSTYVSTLWMQRSTAVCEEQQKRFRGICYEKDDRRGRILGRNPDKSRKNFPPCYSKPPLQLFLRFLFLQTHATSYSFCKEEGKKT